MFATSIGSYCAQMPPAERKSGIPDSVLMPAPVSTTHGLETPAAEPPASGRKTGPPEAARWRRRSNSSVSLSMLMPRR
jgi:hypothetical protein